MARRLTDSHRNVDQLIRLYGRTYNEVLGELLLLKNSEFDVNRGRRILGRIEAILERTGIDTGKWLDENIPAIYRDGADDIVRELNKTGAGVRVAAGFDTSHERAIEDIVDKAAADFATGLSVVKREAIGAFNEATKLRIRDQIAVSTVRGEALKKLSGRIENVVRSEGTTALIDRGGRRWRLDTYATMLARTKHREAYVTGTVNRLLENGYDLVQISTHGAVDSCGPWEGQVLTISGKTPGFPTLDDAQGSGDHIFGPNCRHTLGAYVPGLSDKTKAYNPETGLYESPPPSRDGMGVPYRPNSRLRGTSVQNTPLSRLGFDPDHEVTVYRGVPNGVNSINDGDWVTTDSRLARNYAGNGKVISKRVKAKHLLGDPNDTTEELIYSTRARS